MTLLHVMCQTLTISHTPGHHQRAVVVVSLSLSLYPPLPPPLSVCSYLRRRHPCSR